MKLVISGANGYIGQNLIKRFQSSGIEIIKIGRKELYDIPQLVDLITGTDVVVHLAGAPILQRWTVESKTEIIKSRVLTSQNIVNAINQIPLLNRPKTYISASAVGIYNPNEAHTEKSLSFSTDFVGEVVQKWEDSSSELDRTVRKVIFRIGVVLGKESQTIKKLLPVFKLGLGGSVGNGKQPFPYVHIEDVTSAFYWAIQNFEVTGIYNLVAPQTITNNQFTKALSKSLNRPAFFSVPSTALKLLYGEASSLMLESPIVIPERIDKYGFRFKYPDIKSCFEEIVG